jgi:hypothetical protein
MVPASEAQPTDKNIFQRINIKLIGGILIIIVILGIFIYILSGSGRSKLENSLAGLAPTSVTPISTIRPTIVSTTEKVTQVSNTPFVSPTFRPTRTQAIVIIGTPTNRPIKATPIVTTTQTAVKSVAVESNCRDVLSITMADVGQTLCVQGTIIDTIENPTNYIVIFNTRKGSFYWVTYDMVWSKGEVDKCYQLNGKIDHLANSPVLVFSYNNLPEECP